jgi:MFS family permease
MCVGQLGSLLPHVVVPSILAGFLIPEWHLTGARAGLLAGSGAAGYMLTVPVLATLTDRIDARKILIAGSAVSSLGTLLFGLFADGLWSGALFNAIAGIGFAGAYMPGLKALTDRLAPGDSSRAITLYTSSFSFGVGLSFLVSQLVAEVWGWRSAFFVTAVGPSRQPAACSISLPCSRTGRRWDLYSATARIASSFTAFEPGSSRSGPSSWLGTQMLPC